MASRLRALPAAAAATFLPVAAAVPAVVVMPAVVCMAAVCRGIVKFAAGAAVVHDDHAFVVERETFDAAFVAGGVVDVAIVVLCDSTAAPVVIVVVAAIVVAVEAVAERLDSIAGAGAAVVIDGGSRRMSSGLTRRSLSPSRYVTKKVPSGFALVIRPG